MITEQLYKEKICSNCANENCKNRIKTTTQLDLVIEQMSTTTVMKCEDFVCKEKRKDRAFRGGY